MPARAMLANLRALARHAREGLPDGLRPQGRARIIPPSIGTIAPLT